jgi:hypothetical protein
MLWKYTRAVEQSGAEKLIGCSATWVTQASCWKLCAWFLEGCYASYGNAGIWTNGLNKLAGGKTVAIDARIIARDEAKAIDALSGDYDLRVHVVGDCRSNEAAGIVGKATWRYVRRGGRKAWTYCHTWRIVARKSWGRALSVLASCETLQDVRSAMRAGYAAALVVESHPADGKAFEQDGLTMVPCPNQTRGVTCLECQLCWKDAWLRRAKRVITFAPHGSGAKSVKATLIQIAALPVTEARARALTGR